MTVYDIPIGKSSAPYTAPLALPSGGAGGAVGGSLGILTKSCNPPPPRLERWALQSAAKDILKGERIRLCLRRPVPHAAGVKVLRSLARESFHYGNLMVCGSVWTCPVCASKITEKRRSELSEGVARWQDNGGGVLLLTLTVPHYANQSLAFVLDGLTDARRRMLNRKPWKRLSQSLGIVGQIRAVEVTHGANGWHPHFHILLFTANLFSWDSLPVMETMILSQWQSACKAAGLPIPNGHGVSLEDGSKAAAYATKWGLEHEMTKGHVKKGKEGGMTPFDLLRWYLADKSPRAAALFSEYAKQFKGKRQLVWSDGLRGLLDLDNERTDEELAKAQEDDASLFAQLPLNVWLQILKADLRGQLLEVCKEGEDAMWEWLADRLDEAGLIGDS